MRRALLIICVLLCITNSILAFTLVSKSFQDVMEYWLTDDEIVDFNKDGIVNIIDYALIQSYGSDDYGLDTYGN